MTVIGEIRDAVEDYHKLYLDSPKVAYMSAHTLGALKIETAAYSKYCVVGCVEKLYGMQIVENDRLPMGMVIVGGVLCDVFERWENK